MGVLYHLKHPLLGLERVCALSTDIVVLSSFILQERHGVERGAEHRLIMEFYETDEFGGRTDNWLAPTLPCLLALCRTAGFARVELQATNEFGASIMCYRRWLPSANTSSAAKLLQAVHYRNWGKNFLSDRDEALKLIVETEDSEVDRLSVFPEAGGFGVIPYWVGRLGDGVWQINCKLPPGTSVRVAIRDCSHPKQRAQRARPHCDRYAAYAASRHPVAGGRRRHHLGSVQNRFQQGSHPVPMGCRSSGQRGRIQCAG